MIHLPNHSSLSLRQQPANPNGASTDDVRRTVPIPIGHWWRRLFAFAGPAYMVSVGYMDPGNWATDIEGGARFGYQLLWVLLMSNIMAVLLQTLSARLGLVTGRDLAQACRSAYPSPVRWVLFVLCEIAIAACDLAEVLGTAIGINLLFGIPLVWAVLITGLDVLLLLGIQRLGIRKMEAFIILLISTIGLCFIVELFLCRPSMGGIAGGLIPKPLTNEALYIAMGMIGATVMPHNLYLHSSLAQSRDVKPTPEGIAQACKYNFIDSAIALNAAFFVNAAILTVSASSFFSHGIVVTEIQQAHGLLEDILSSRVAPIAFAVALICAGQSSTLTGTLAGQITMEGFLHFRMRPWLRRLITRSLAITPAVLVIWLAGDKESYRLLIFSQVLLSMQLPFAVVPLIKFTNNSKNMGQFVNPLWLKIAAWIVTMILVVLNMKLIYGQIGEWANASGDYKNLVLGVSIPVALALGTLLAMLLWHPGTLKAPAPPPSVEDVASAALAKALKFQRIGVALEAHQSDTIMLAEAIALAQAHRAELILMHIVEGVGGQWYGQQTDDQESRHDESYMHALAAKLQSELAAAGVPAVRAVLGYGSVTAGLVQLSQQEKIDLLVMGGHGHRGLSDLWRGQTIPAVRHGISVPVFAVRHPTQPATESK